VDSSSEGFESGLIHEHRRCIVNTLTHLRSFVTPMIGIVEFCTYLITRASCLNRLQKRRAVSVLRPCPRIRRGCMLVESKSPRETPSDCSRGEIALVCCAELPETVGVELGSASCMGNLEISSACFDIKYTGRISRWRSLLDVLHRHELTENPSIASQSSRWHLPG
jgi:hypothetical protein